MSGLSLSQWSKDDLKQYQILDTQLSKHVHWQVSTTELVQVYQSLVWFAGLRAKIEQSQAEVLSVREAKPEERERVEKSSKKPKE